MLEPTSHTPPTTPFPKTQKPLKPQKHNGLSRTRLKSELNNLWFQNNIKASPYQEKDKDRHSLLANEVQNELIDFRLKCATYESRIDQLEKERASLLEVMLLRFFLPTVPRISRVITLKVNDESHDWWNGPKA